MKLKNPLSISEHFSDLPDPRVDRTKEHLLQDILTIAICAVICGADGWVEVEQFGRAKLKWFSKFLALPKGIPSHDTFGRVFSMLNPEEFGRCFLSWIKTVAEVSEGEIVAIDGKTLRKSFDRANSKAAIHMVSAWANANKLVLGQVKTEEKSNEITAIPKLLKLLELKGCIVTIDAMGTQKKIANQIVDQGADYVLSLKGNQELFAKEVKEFFEDAQKDNFKETAYSYTEEVGKGHGRIERRRYWLSSEVEWFAERKKWKGLRSFGMVESEREIGENRSVERRFYISSLSGDDVESFAKASRSHWGIENKLHWVLDVAFREDDCRVRKDNAAQNFAMLRHVALNLLKQENSVRIGIKAKRLKAGWNEDYLLKILRI
jgi:predicted transposase YbfD/YdcC